MSHTSRDSHTGDPVAVLAAAAKQRRRAGARATAALPKRGRDDDGPRMPDTLFEAGGAIEAMESAAAAEAASARKVRKPVARKPAKPHRETLASACDDPPTGPGMVTRGVHAGLGGLQLTREGTRRLGAWGVASLAALTMVLVLSVHAGRAGPEPGRVTGVRIAFLPGPTLPDTDVLAMLRAFPRCGELSAPDDGVLNDLATFLRDQPAVAAVDQVRVIHDAVDHGQPSRRIALTIGLRQPVLPVVLATGQRAWVDAEGRTLPGILPGPPGRPVLRAIEYGGALAVREALDLWARLDGRIEPGLITDIHLHDDLGLKGQRGLVLYTRTASRLVWGRPDDATCGLDPAQKARDLVHALRSHSDLSRVASINVRFKQPVLVPR